MTIQLGSAFVMPKQSGASSTLMAMKLEKYSEDTMKPLVKKIGQFATTAAVVVATSPLMSLAEEADDYGR